MSALIADKNIATATVTANWRNNSPEMPGMKATGTNTESSTRRNRDDRRGDFAHRQFGRVGRRQFRMLLHHPLNVLDHDDGVVDDDADGKHNGEQRYRIGRIADREQSDKRTD